MREQYDPREKSPVVSPNEQKKARPHRGAQCRGGGGVEAAVSVGWLGVSGAWGGQPLEPPTNQRASHMGAVGDVTQGAAGVFMTICGLKHGFIGVNPQADLFQAKGIATFLWYAYALS